ncbi:sulfotransferase family 2 domain-containing protein [Porticoccus litoralis]
MKLSKMLWCLMPKTEKQWIERAMGPLEFRQFKKMLNGEKSLPVSFHEKKAIFVHIPKTAGSSIYDLFFDGAKGLGHMPYAWYESIAPGYCSKYFSFSFVRNPWDRVVSAYHFVLSGGAPRRDGPMAKEFSRFKNFDDFVVNWLNEDAINCNLHFVPQYKFLLNAYGELGPDYVGRFESMNDHLKHICRAVNVSSSQVSSLKVINKSQRGDIIQTALLSS